MCIQLRTILQCPACGFKVTERMTSGRLISQWQCPACEELVSAEERCIYCEIGSVPCPSKQEGNDCLPC